MVERSLPLLAIVLWALSAAPHGARGQSAEPKTVWEGKVRVGDDPSWTQPDFDDSDWATRRLYVAPDTQAIHWIRASVTLESSSPPLDPKGLKLSVLAATEVYWDGVRIGRSGRVGSSRTHEQPGPISSVHPVPDSLYTAGTHLIAVRLSNFYMPPDYGYYLYRFAVGDYASLITEGLRGTLLPLLFLGGFVLIMVYCGVLYALDRRRTAVGLFSVLCLCVSLLLALEVSRWAVGYTYDWHATRLLMVTSLLAAVAVLLPLFFMVQFEFPWKAPVMATLAGLLGLSLVVPDATDFRHYWMLWSTLGVSLAVVGWAVVRGKRGSVLALVSVGVCIGALAVFELRFLSTYFFPTFAVIVMSLLASLGFQMREQRRQREHAELTAARLEIELLKKHLQPHFLMNTLTAAMEWMDEQPETGVRFIHSIAQELRLLSEVSDRTRIPLAKELELCRLHLEVMGFRQDRTFRLQVDEVDPDASVPPAVFHTLLENALTHNQYTDREVCFRLTGDALDRGRRYTLRAPFDGTTSPPDREGTGLRYVKARLTESYGTDWTLDMGPQNGTWTTVIELHDRD